MNNIDFNSMNDADFEALASVITAERQRRTEERQANLWGQVKRALYEYVNNFGYIDICSGDYYIDKDSDLASPGEIH